MLQRSRFHGCQTCCASVFVAMHTEVESAACDCFRHPEVARRCGTDALVPVQLCSQVTLAIALFFGRSVWGYALSSDPEVVRRVAGILFIISFMLPSDGLIAVSSGEPTCRALVLEAHTARPPDQLLASQLRSGSAREHIALEHASVKHPAALRMMIATLVS